MNEPRRNSMRTSNAKRQSLADQDEPTKGLGDGDTGPDAIITGNTVLLRAERSGKSEGRVYHIHFTAADHEGTSSGVVTVNVPHNKATADAFDRGELFDSTR